MLSKERFGKFVSVGIIGAAFDTTVLVLLVEVVGLAEEAAVLLGIKVASLLMFVLNDSWTSADTGQADNRLFLSGSSNYTPYGLVAIPPSSSCLSPSIGSFLSHSKLLELMAGYLLPKQVVLDSACWSTIRLRHCLSGRSRNCCSKRVCKVFCLQPNDVFAHVISGCVPCIEHERGVVDDLCDVELGVIGHEEYTVSIG